MQVFRKSPIPFEKIACAVGLTPHLEANVVEAFRLASLYEAKLWFMHIGNSSNLRTIGEIIERQNVNGLNYNLIVESGNVVDELLAQCKKLEIDLLIAGALEKESPLKYYLGSVSRKICRKAKCSVLVLRELSKTNSSINKIVVNCIENRKTLHTINTAVYIAQMEKINSLDLVLENQLHGLSTLINCESSEVESENFQNELITQERKRLDNITKNVDFKNIAVKKHLIYAKPGLGISNFARDQGVDLMIVNSPDTQLGLLDRIFPHDLEYTLEDLPSSLLIVHSRE